MLRVSVNKDNSVSPSSKRTGRSFKPTRLLLLAILALSAFALVGASPALHAQTPTVCGGVDTAPVIGPQAGSFVSGQSVTVFVTWGCITGHTYIVSLYASPVDSCLGPFTASELVTVTSGDNPAGSGQSGPGPTIFTFTAPSSNLYICASVTDPFVSPSRTLWSGVASYTVAPPLTSYNTNPQERVSIDAGQTVQLTDYPSGGAPPYTYAWYRGVSCPASPSFPFFPALTPVGTSASINVTSLTVPETYRYSVVVNDSSIGTYPNTICETVLVKVNPALSGTLVINGLTGQISGQIGSPALTAVVTFTGGTGPWYAVTVYGGTNSSCSADTTVVAHLDDITGTEAIFSFPEPSTPSSITYYCAALTDSSVGTPAITAVLGPIQLNVSPALSTPTFSISTQAGSNATDYGQPSVLVTATVTYSGGTSPYVVTLYGGSQKSCADDYSRVVTINQIINRITTSNTLGRAVTTYSSVQFTFLSPAASTYYCAVVYDSSVPASVTMSSTAQFTVESLFAVNAPALSTAAVEVLNPLYEGNPVTATVTWSGGAGPYTVALYQGSYNADAGTCTPTSPPTIVVATPGSNPQTGLTGSSATFSFLAPNPTITSSVTYCYYATVTDFSTYTVTSLNSFNTPSTAGFASLVVSPPFGIPRVVLHATQNSAWLPETDTGQTESVTATVTWSGGNAPYKVSLYGGGSSTCSLDTTQVGSTQAGIITPNQPLTTPPTYSATFTFTSPATTTFYCAKVTDASVPVSTGSTVRGAVWTVNAPPTVSLPASYEIAAGSATSITATVVTPGSAPDYLRWFIGSACAGSAVTGAPPASTTTYNTGVISTATTYSVQITDSSHGTPVASACASVTIGVNSGPAGVAVVTSPSPVAGLVYVATPYSGSSSASGDSITVINSRSNTAIKTIPLTSLGLFGSSTTYPVDPWGVAVDSVNGYVFVTGEAVSPVPQGVVVVISVTTNTEVGAYWVGQSPEGVALNVALLQLYVANSADNTVSVFSASTSGVLTALANGASPAVSTEPACAITASTGCAVGVGAGPESIAVDQKTYTVFVTDSGGNTVSVIQPATGVYPITFAVITVNVGSEPVGVAVYALTDNVYVANYGSGTVSVLDGRTYATIATINVGGNPTGVDIDSPAATAYVANAATNAVTVINLYNNTPTASTIPVGGSPFGVAVLYNPSNTAHPLLAYVTNQGSNAVSVIDLATGQVIATIVVPMGS